MAARRGLYVLVALAGMLAGGSGGWPQVAPYGPEFQVNVFTPGFEGAPSVSVSPDGTFSIVWSCDSCGAPEILRGRRFDAMGTPLGPELPMSQFRGDWPSDLGADSAGNFVVVWGQGLPGPGGGGSDYVKGRRFTWDAIPRSDEFVISPPPGSEYTGDGRVAVHDDGAFVVTWWDYGVFAQRYDTGGLPVGSTFQVAGGSSPASQPGIATEPDGGFLVIWHEHSAPPGGSSIRGQRYDGSGDPMGPVIPISGSAITRSNDIARAPDGSFVVAWSSYPQGAHEVTARRIAPDGQPLGPEFRVNSQPMEHATLDLEVAAAQDGSFLIVWNASGSPGEDPDRSVQARRFSPEATPLGNQFQVNSLTTGYQADPWAAFQPDGDFVVAWTSDVSAGSDDSVTSVQARRFRPPFFMDGFESGDTSRWSAAIP